MDESFARDCSLTMTLKGSPVMGEGFPAAIRWFFYQVQPSLLIKTNITLNAMGLGIE